MGLFYNGPEHHTGHEDDIVYCSAQGQSRGLSCIIMFLGRHFLFTCSDTSAVGCIVQPQRTEKNEPPKFQNLE